MTSPEYRQRMQRLADFLTATLPDPWHSASMRVTFTSPVSTRLEVRYSVDASGSDQPIRVPSSMMRDFVGAARDVRAELVRAGNCECSGFVFRLTRDGKSALDVEYPPKS